MTTPRSLSHSAGVARLALLAVDGRPARTAGGPAIRRYRLAKVARPTAAARPRETRERA